MLNLLYFFKGRWTLFQGEIKLFANYIKTFLLKSRVLKLFNGKSSRHHFPMVTFCPLPSSDLSGTLAVFSVFTNMFLLWQLGI